MVQMILCIVKMVLAYQFLKRVDVSNSIWKTRYRIVTRQEKWQIVQFSDTLW